MQLLEIEPQKCNYFKTNSIFSEYTRYWPPDLPQAAGASMFVDVATYGVAARGSVSP